MVVNIPANGDISHLEKIIDDLCYILSVARGTKIQWVYYKLYNETGKCISVTHFSRITKPYCPPATADEQEKCKPLLTTKDEYFFLIHFLDKIFLKLLGYHGPYVDWSSPGKPIRREKL